MRDIKTLLELTLEQVKDDSKRNYLYGICSSINRLKDNLKITFNEGYFLHDYIYENKPIGINSLDVVWWRGGILKPRIKFLEKLIKTLKNDN